MCNIWQAPSDKHEKYQNLSALNEMHGSSHKQFLGQRLKGDKVNAGLGMHFGIFKKAYGFTLTEVLVVMVIIGILATGVVFMFSDPTAKVKAAAFEMRGDFNLARAQAVRRNSPILIQFLDSAQESCSKETTTFFGDCFAGGNFQGYAICFDENGDNDCSDEAGDATEMAEKVIKVAIFNTFVKFYDIGATAPSQGPDKAPNGHTLTSKNGITFANDFISMNPDGTSSDVGDVVIYYPSGTKIRGKPYAVDVNNVGRVQLFRWRYELTDDVSTPDDERWSRK